MKIVSQLAFFFILPLSLYAQNKFTKELLKNNSYGLAAGLFLSTGESLPFWLQANQYGEVPSEPQFFQFSGAVKHDYDSLFSSDGKLKKFDWGYGARAVANLGKVNQFIISEGYLKARYAHFEIYAGRRKEIFGQVDTSLTTGSYIWSGNALPMPKIQVSIPNFTPILKNKLISIKGGFAHGWFDEGRLYTSHIKLHQKWLYFKLGKPSWRISIYGGGNHQAQWGGYSPFYTVNGKLPDGFQNYLSVVLGTRGAITGVPETQDFDANRIGNHLGSIDLGMEIKLSKSKIFLYRQSIYDDGSLFYLNNIQDGLTGLSWAKNLSIKPISTIKILIEYLDTNNQGGENFILFTDDLELAPPQLRGSDQYFNNVQIKDGWVNKNRTIGTPFIYVPNELNDFDNNRLKMIQIGIGCYFSNFSILARNSFVKNYGTAYKPLSGQITILPQLQLVKKVFDDSSLEITLSSNSNNSPFGLSLGTIIVFNQRL